MDKGFLVLIVGLGMLLTAVPANAFHGAPYQARGLACFGSDAVCQKATLVWGGALGAAGNLQLIIHDPVRETSAVRLTMPGWESFGNLGFGPAVHCSLAEHTTTYLLRDAPSQGKVFTVGGGMELCFDGPNAGLRFCDLAGTFLQGVSLRFTCDRAVA